MATKRKKAERGADYYQSRRGDHSAWDIQATPATVAPTGTTVFSIRLPVAELEAMRKYAAKLGTSVSDFLRTAGAKTMAVNPLEVSRAGEGTRASVRAIWIDGIALADDGLDFRGVTTIVGR